MAVAEARVDDDPPVRGDQKKGWSTFCRSDRFESCTLLKARCANPAHGRAGQQPPSPVAVVPSAPAAAMPPASPPADPPITETPAEKSGAAGPPPRKAVAHARVVAAALARRRVIEALHRLGDVIEDSSGRAGAKLSAVGELDYDGPKMTAVLSQMAERGLIERVVNGKRTTRICLTGAGLAILDDEAAEPSPPPRPAARPAKAAARRTPPTRPEAKTPADFTPAPLAVLACAQAHLDCLRYREATFRLVDHDGGLAVEAASTAQGGGCRPRVVVARGPRRRRPAPCRARVGRTSGGPRRG